jgi:hypothetical protein
MKPNPISSVVIAVMLAMLPQVAKAGPCASDIAELETTLQQPGVEAVGVPGQVPIDAKPSHRLASGVAEQTDEHRWPQFSATIARAKRLDVYGDRLGCTAALNAARGMFVLVERE